MWQATLLDASFKGVAFDVMEVHDDVSRDVQAHYYPYVDGADQEDLGRQARQFSMTAVFFGNFYELQLQSFLSVLNESGAGELVHPIFGVFPQVQLVSYKVSHSAEYYDYCTVSLQFVEHQDSNPFFAFAHALQALEGVGLKMGSFINTALSVFSRGMAYYRLATGIVERVHGIKALFSSSALAISRFFSGSYFGGTSRSSGAVAGNFNTSLSHADVIASPSGFMSDMTNNMDEVLSLKANYLGHTKNDLDLLQSEWASLMGATRQINLIINQQTVSTVLPEDKALLKAMINITITNAMVGNALVLLELAQKEQLFTTRQIDVFLSDIRRLIQECIDAIRLAFSKELAYELINDLRSVAYQLQTIAMQILEARPPLIKYVVLSDSNLHLLAHHLYADYERASELLRLNPTIKNPNFIQSGEVLNVYAE